MLPTKYIEKVGIELEGGWNRRFKDTDIFGDISVQRPVNTGNRPCQCDNQGHSPSTCHWGEIASPPLELESALGWMKDHFPDGVNATCGFHVHVSVKNTRLYAELTEKTFFNYFLSEVRKFGKSEGFPEDHPLWHRLREKSNKAPHPARFCNRPYAAHEQMALTTKTDARRSALNYCYAMHGTIECRVFPAWPDPEVAARAVLTYTNAIEDWLSHRPPVKSTVLLLKIRELEKARKPFQILSNNL